jgi:hypothetical protein
VEWDFIFQPVRNPLADEGLLTLGRAVHVSSMFEANCRFVLRIGNLVESIESDPVLGLEHHIAAAPKDGLLHKTLDRLLTLLPKAADQAGVLSAAREARNYIAHEAAVFDLRAESTTRMMERLEELRPRVRDLASGDNVVSTWMAAIEEPDEHRPRDLIAAYPDVIDRWVFHPVWELLGTGDTDTDGAAEPDSESDGE